MAIDRALFDPDYKSEPFWWEAARPGTEHHSDLPQTTEVFVVEGAGHLIHDELVSRDTFRKTALDFLHRHGLMS